MWFAEALEALGSFGSFWLFVFSPSYRRACLEKWRGRSAGGRLLGLLEATVAAAMGLVPFILIGWLLTR